MTTWTATHINHLTINLDTEDGLDIGLEASDGVIIVADGLDFWVEDGVPTDIWTKRNE